MMNRRLFCSSTTSFAACALIGPPTLPSSLKERRFTLDLRCGSIGVQASQREAIALAAKHGFESVNAEPTFLATLDDPARVALLASMQTKKLTWGAAGLPVDFRRDEKRFRQDLKRFPSLCEGLQKAGVTRVGTYIMPRHAQLTYMANFRQHTNRLRACVKIMVDHGLRFGIEYVGPKTLWASQRHSFIHTMAEAMELLDAIGLRKHTGLVLDSWHWYTAHETVDDLKKLTNADIVACDLNDAPKGLAIDEQIDNRRELPTDTGVIDLTAFLNTLNQIGYDGPIRAEPFNAALNKLNNDDACAATAKAMKSAFALVRQ